MKLKIIAGTALVLLLASSTSQAKSWRGITPLKSTRADVERLLGKPNSLGRYQFENERAYISYAEKPCELVDCVCLVSRDTVLEIFVTVEVEMKFSELKIDRTKYNTRRSTHLLTYASYSNADEGIVYHVADDEVTEIIYFHSAKDCREVLRNNRDANRRKKYHRLRNKLARCFALLNVQGVETCAGHRPRRPFQHPAL